MCKSTAARQRVGWSQVKKKEEEHEELKQKDLSEQVGSLHLWLVDAAHPSLKSLTTNSLTTIHSFYLGLQLLLPTTLSPLSTCK